ncbi:hypothetical protein HYV43_00655 [Candidatus Micrarchaeota archaeon]|nr:hypothetical protein [Candidatus Micrarchaeota archaeon]
MKEHPHAHSPAGHPEHPAHPVQASVRPGSDDTPKPAWVLFALLALVVAVTAYNQLQITDVQYAMAGYSTAAARPAVSAPGGAPQGSSSANLQALADRILPKGIPAVYGKELSVSYDDPVAAMKVLAPLDDGIQLSAEQNARYVKIASQISCEYCCGAESIIFANGQAACGCQHSYVMRGLAKYLLTKHGTEYTNDQVLDELGKWKTLFFPKQILTKALAFESAGKAINTIDLTSNKYRGFTAAAASAGSGSAQGVASLPNMVGGC